jgi:hypothetical protein
LHLYPNLLAEDSIQLLSKPCSLIYWSNGCSLAFVHTWLKSFFFFSKEGYNNHSIYKGPIRNNSETMAVKSCMIETASWQLGDLVVKTCTQADVGIMQGGDFLCLGHTGSDTAPWIALNGWETGEGDIANGQILPPYQFIRLTRVSRLTIWPS